MTSRLVDVHAHLQAEDFDRDRGEVLARAAAAGVVAVLAVGEGADDNPRVLEVAGADARIQPCLGLHPDRFAEPRLEEVLAQIREHADRLVAVGEVGLDYWRAQEEPQRREQREILATLASLARELDLPLNVHSRSAGRATLELLEELAAPCVLMHAFDGRAHYAVQAAERGVWFSIPPSLLRSPQKEKLVGRLPLERMLLESDSPVLGPTREERNEPANLAHTLHRIAELRGVPEEELAGILYQNTLQAFPRLAARLPGASS